MGPTALAGPRLRWQVGGHPRAGRRGADLVKSAESSPLSIDPPAGAGADTSGESPPLAAGDWIRIRGARQHNLAGIDLDLPKNRLVVITGVSGSGKSSLAFDTLYAEGQRRYVESLSSYARQFLDRLEKPDVDRIDGLSPALAIEQRTAASNPRSTVATATEIHDYLRVLFAAAGRPHDPATGEPIERWTTDGIVGRLAGLAEGARLHLLAPVGGTGDVAATELKAVVERLQRQGFVRVTIDGAVHEIETLPKFPRKGRRQVEAVVDRLVVRAGLESRLADSVEAALQFGEGEMRVLVQWRDGGDGGPDAGLRSEEIAFTTRWRNPATGFTLEQLSPKLFSFNSAAGACPGCHGTGQRLEADPGKLVPDPDKTLNEGAVRTWWARHPRLRGLQQRAILGLAAHFKADPDLPFERLPEAFVRALWHGTEGEAVPSGWQVDGTRKSLAKPWEGLAAEAKRLYRESSSETTRRLVARFMRGRRCDECGGHRLRPEVLAVRVFDVDGRGWGIHDAAALTVDEAAAWLGRLQIGGGGREVLADALRELAGRIGFLREVGLGYLTLQRETGSLSGGESQRIRLATQLGAGLSGVLYVLDEPSIGLHQEDNRRLLRTLHRLRDQGNSVIVVEHDEDTIRAADWVVDMGPGAGPRGGRVLAAGPPGLVAGDEASVTGAWLRGQRRIQPPERRVVPPRVPSDWGRLREGHDLLETGWLVVHEAAEHNLKRCTAAFPVGGLSCVTGVSGSGKSTLVNDVLRPVLARRLHRAGDVAGGHGAVTGHGHFDKLVVIDQSPLGRSPRSNPVTYVAAWGPIRELFAKLPAAKVRGYGPGRFSFNTPGGRCEKCRGDGSLKLDMHFLADAWVRCDACDGRRFNRETLEVTFQGRSIHDVLEMTIEEACRFFLRIPPVHDKLRPLAEVGLGYLKLGQAATTLSGGEAQRVKLAGELARRATGRTLYLLDEPTTGLHFEDVDVLLRVLLRLRDQGNTLVVIEHNLDLIRCADWLVDLGPGGGEHGGEVVAMGTPEQVAASANSVTGKWLRRAAGGGDG